MTRDRIATLLFEDVPQDPSLADPLPASPLPLFGRWLEEAKAGRVQPNPDAFCLATVDPDGRPSARMLLCRGYLPDPGCIVFYTNRRSRKGAAMAPGSYATAVFHWDALARQVRLEGPVLFSPEDESDAYFAGRPRPGQLSAWASEQSAPIASRVDLLARLHEVEQRFGAEAGAPVPRPGHWGGYRLYIEAMELWVGSAGRAHDRGLWTRTLRRDGELYRGGEWAVTRLQP